LPNMKNLDNYLKLLENLTKDTLGELPCLLSERALFTDPFNNVRGRSLFVKAIGSVLEDSSSHVFRITTRSDFSGGTLICWELSMKPHHWALKSKDIRINGASKILLDDLGLIDAHYDYWDAASNFYEKLPFIGWILVRIRQKLVITS